MTITNIDSPESWVADLPFERLGALRRAVKAGVAQPFANYCPPRILKFLLRLMGSELASENWRDPGGWRSMVISYHGKPPGIADWLLVTLGTMPMALRNRRMLAARVIARLIDRAEHEPVHVLCLGAGPGHIIGDALREARRKACATLVDLSSGAHDYGRKLAERNGHADRMRFIQGDVCDVEQMLERPPDIVKMLGICEYIADKPLTTILRAVAKVMRPGTAIVFNSLSDSHGTDRFFRRVFHLEMIHRTPEHLQELMRAGGFGDFVSLPEPLGVYHVIIGRRQSDESRDQGNG